MGLYDIYSKRQRRMRGEFTDVYTYDKIPHQLKVQIIHIINDCIDSYYSDNDIVNQVFVVPEVILCREYGLFELIDKYAHNHPYPVLGFFEKTKDSEEALDVIELVFQAIDTVVRENFEQHYSDSVNPDEAISDLNARFKEHGLGFSFDAGMLIRVDSTFTHSEIIKPTISLLANPIFAGANDEYLTAHEHYRHGRNKECLIDCLKAFESTMKIICAEKGWAFDPAKDTANRLIQICFAEQLVPTFMQTHISALKSVLESGIPTVRNKLAGHGQGTQPRDVDDEVARYGLNLTGSNIIFLVEQSGL
jgi:hypothetical protein